MKDVLIIDRRMRRQANKRRIWIWLMCVLLPLGVMAQRRAEYNRKGDEAMKRLDYSDAKMWYEEGVALCDTYSIRQLTQIWLTVEQMRPSMRSLMNKCLNCLTVQATEDDPDAIERLILYYTEGIGTPKSEELASYWKEYQERLRMPVEPVYPVADSTPLSSPGRRMRFFVGYTYSVESPYGVSVGGVGQRFGWYVRFKTNMSFMNYTGECNDRGEIIDFSNAEDESYEPDARQSSKTNSFAGSVGLIVKCCPWLYASVGLGYGKRTLLHAFTTHAYENYADTRSIWCKNMDSSYQGVMAEVDAMVRLGDMFFVSVGCNTLNFKYMDLNAGVGVFF